ncbi:MAG: S8 family serine peptidase [Rhodospirillaceae bacterium]
MPRADFRLTVFPVLAAIAFTSPAALAAPGDPVDVAGIRAVVESACRIDPTDVDAVRAALPGSRLLDARIDQAGGRPGRSYHRVLVPGGGEWVLTKLFPGGRLRRVTVEWRRPSPSGARPELSANADAGCRITEGRRIVYKDGRAETLLILSADLTSVADEQPLNPPVPPAAAARGKPTLPRVAVVDTGVNYTLAPFQGRLARDAAGDLIGYDFWDMDTRPFDVDTARSPFFPLHHGTAVASVLLREAPDVALVPYRYPRPDMARFGDLVSHAADHGVVIVNMAMGSDSRSDWQAFETAAKSRPDMLFIVSAGNDGRDLDREPVFPAALGLANVLSVTSSDEWGRLAPGSNWGAASVDVMTPGENIPVIDHRGAAGKASGSSFAVPRVTALAARLAAKHLDWKGPEIKRAVVKRARATDGGRRVRYGWIPDPTDDFEK